MHGGLLTTVGPPLNKTPQPPGPDVEPLLAKWRASGARKEDIKGRRRISTVRGSIVVMDLELGHGVPAAERAEE
jgi:hypothetical protein